jgi:hypothetical protein
MWIIECNYRGTGRNKSTGTGLRKKLKSYSSVFFLVKNLIIIENGANPSTQLFLVNFLINSYLDSCFQMHSAFIPYCSTSNLRENPIFNSSPVCTSYTYIIQIKSEQKSAPDAVLSNRHGAVAAAAATKRM